MQISQKSDNPREIAMQTHHYRDFDAFASDVRGANLTMMLQHLKHPSWSISHVDLSGVHVQLGREGSGNITEGQARSDGYIVFIPLNHAGAYAANGTALDKDSFAILEPGCDFCLRSEIEHDWSTIFVPTDKIALGGDLVEPSPDYEKVTCRVTRPKRQLADWLRASVSQVMTAAAHCSQFESTPAATRAAGELVRVASLVVGKTQACESNQKGRPRVPRPEIIRRSKELLEAREGKRVLVGELAAAADVSKGTLRTAFNEYFGVGPIRYLQIRQLHQVNRALRATDPEAAGVTDVLVRHGEWEFGRFASRYRQLFGELPSETLQTKRR
jgi:AraC family ethanolamine operon transcriptional activator